MDEKFASHVLADLGSRSVIALKARNATTKVPTLHVYIVSLYSHVYEFNEFIALTSDVCMKNFY